MTGHVSGNPDIVHTAQDPAECACRRYRRPDRRIEPFDDGETSADISEQHDPDNRDG